MENASKALLMAAGILIGVLILSLMTSLFISSKELSSSYEETKKSEEIQQFNVNFTKYLGQDLNIHQIITIYNFAKQNGFEELNIVKDGGNFTLDNTQISKDLNDANSKLGVLTDYYKVEKIYKLTIEAYDNETGHISKIKISQPIKKFKCYKKDVSTGNIVIDYKN